MMNPNSEFHIFYDSRHSGSAAELVARLGNELRRASPRPSLEELLQVLLQAGELECALADAPADLSDVVAASQLTEILAEAAIACDLAGHSREGLSLSPECLPILQSIAYSGPVSVSTPEGFAYYALHPLDFGDLIACVARDCRCAFVVGIRSIGTTLSAVVWAKLRQLGVEAGRTTVRPVGHPYDRECALYGAQRQAIARSLAMGAEFVVCDEGPGRSGSSLLCVAEALEREGVRPKRILILCSHEAELSALCAPDAERRWRRYRSAATGMTRRLPEGADRYVGGGEWRRHLLAPGEDWPAVWPQMERLKYLSADRSELFTFEGYGLYGAAVRNRNRALSDSGFGAPYLGQERGFGRHSLPRGRAIRLRDLTLELLTRMAGYCAWRAREFAIGYANTDGLEAMTRANLEREFSTEAGDLALPLVYPTVCDNRMAPLYWRPAQDNRWLKLDAAIHGDDHFFPGPCDIAWDLAGVVVEWDLDSSSRELFLAQYRRASGDDPMPRIAGYELAYAMFRLAWSKMAAASVAEGEEEARLIKDHRRYRDVVQRCMAPVAGCAAATRF
jgi:hypothetical protein